MSDFPQKNPRPTHQVPPYFDQILANFDPESTPRCVHLGFWQEDTPPPADFADFIDAQQRLNQWLLSQVSILDGDSVLDVGCGLGATLQALNSQLSNARLVGVNIDERQLQACRTLQAVNGNRLQWQQADAVSLPFPDNSFDVVLSVEAMFHFSSRQAFFAEAYRVLKPGGRLVITDMLIDPSLPQLPLPGFLIEAAVQDGYGPWPEFWDAEPHQLKAERAGFQSDWWQDISLQTQPSYRFTTPSKVDWLHDSGDRATRSALALRWLHEQGYLKYLAMGFIKAEG